MRLIIWILFIFVAYSGFENWARLIYHITDILAKLMSIPVLHVIALSSIDQIYKRCIPYFKHGGHHGEEKEVEEG